MISENVNPGLITGWLNALVKEAQIRNPKATPGEVYDALAEILEDRCRRIEAVRGPESGGE